MLANRYKVNTEDLKTVMKATHQRVIKSKVERKNKFDIREKKDRLIAKLLIIYPPLRQKTPYGIRVGIYRLKTYDPAAAFGRKTNNPQITNDKTLITSQNHNHCAINLDN